MNQGVIAFRDCGGTTSTFSFTKDGCLQNEQASHEETDRFADARSHTHSSVLFIVGIRIQDWAVCLLHPTKPHRKIIDTNSDCVTNSWCFVADTDTKLRGGGDDFFSKKNSGSSATCG